MESGILFGASVADHSRGDEQEIGLLMVSVLLVRGNGQNCERHGRSKKIMEYTAVVSSTYFALRSYCWRSKFCLVRWYVFNIALVVGILVCCC